MTTLEAINHYEKALTKWFEAKRDHPEIEHGPEPDPKDFKLEPWLSKQIRDRVEYETGKPKDPGC